MLKLIKNEYPNWPINWTNKVFSLSELVSGIENIIVDGVDIWDAYTWDKVFTLTLDVAPTSSMTVTYFSREVSDIRWNAEVTLWKLKKEFYQTVSNLNPDWSIPPIIHKLYPEDVVKDELRKAFKRIVNTSPIENRLQQYSTKFTSGAPVLDISKNNSITLEQSIKNEIQGKFFIGKWIEYDYYQVWPYTIELENPINTLFSLQVDSRKRTFTVWNFFDVWLAYWHIEEELKEWLWDTYRVSYEWAKKFVISRTDWYAVSIKRPGIISEIEFNNFLYSFTTITLTIDNFDILLNPEDYDDNLSLFAHIEGVIDDEYPDPPGKYYIRTNVFDWGSAMRIWRIDWSLVDIFITTNNVGDHHEVTIWQYNEELESVISDNWIKVKWVDLSEVWDKVLVWNKIPSWVQKIQEVRVDWCSLQWVNKSDFYLNTTDRYTISRDEQWNEYLFIPYSDVEQTLIVTYVPDMFFLNDDEDIIDIEEEYSEVIVYSVAVKLLRLKEDDKYISIAEELWDWVTKWKLYDYKSYVKSKVRKSHSQIWFARTNEQ